MAKRRLFLVLGTFWFLTGLTLVAQTAAKTETSTIAIVLNEYSASNINGTADFYGRTSDWVEIRNNNSTFSVSLSGYYLSNDRNNLFKWKFPSNYKLAPKSLGLVWLTGKNTSKNGEFHANFSLEQCKNQWLILSTSSGVVRDSVFVQPTKAGHSRGRIDESFMGINAWRLYTSHSQLLENPTSGYFKNYAPLPQLVVFAGGGNTDSLAGNKGAFNVSSSAVGYFRLNGIEYDTLVDKCFLIYYTVNGDYPVPGAASTFSYVDKVTGSPQILFAQTTVYRFIAVPNYSVGPCASDYLESFCGTNTYFVNPEHQTFKPEFGVVSLAIDSKDTSWFNSQGLPKSTTVHVEYFDKMKQVSEGYAILNRPVQESWKTKQKGFYIDIDDEYGSGCNFEGPIFNVEGLGVSSRTVFPSLHLKGGDIESNSGAVLSGSNVPSGTGLRDVFIQSLAAKNNLNVNPLHIKPVSVFVNGLYWGVYDLREIYDKYYENYYNKQSLDSLDLMFYTQGVDGNISYPDGTFSNFSPASTFSTNVYGKVLNNGLAKPLNSPVFYDALMAQLDKGSFIDYMILNSFCVNTDNWDYNVAFGKGGLASKPGNKWHYYLWNMPTIFNYTSSTTNNPGTLNSAFPPCNIHTTSYPVSKFAGNSHGMILFYLFRSNTGNPGFQLEYKNRYQDLLNGPLKCENLLKHWDYIYNLYSKEMKCHTDPACVTGGAPPRFATQDLMWDTLMYQFQTRIKNRCDAVANYFGKAGCYGVTGPHPITINIEPAGAGQVRLNSILLDSYPWVGSYYQTTMSFKAIPTNTTFVFDHWEFKNHIPKEPLSKDSVTVNYAGWDEVIAVFTDKSRDITATGEGANVPTGFTPNGDGINDYFRPLGSSEFANEYQMTVWNRWGQEVYRTTSPTDIGWDGNYRGQQAITGVYAYIITYRNIYGESKLVKGNVTLTR